MRMEHGALEAQKELSLGGSPKLRARNNLTVHPQKNALIADTRVRRLEHYRRGNARPVALYVDANVEQKKQVTDEYLPYGPMK